MKNIFLCVALVLCLAGGLTKCAKWMQKQDAEAFESCRMIHSDENCRLWLMK